MNSESSRSHSVFTMTVESKVKIIFVIFFTKKTFEKIENERFFMFNENIKITFC